MARQARRLDGVFDRGGVKAIGMVGALAVVEAAGYEFVNVAGVSSGAMVAALLAAGYTAAELRQLLLDLDFSRLADTRGIGRIPLVGPAIMVLAQLGVYEGDRLLDLLRELLAAKGVHRFRDLAVPEHAGVDRYRFRLCVLASDLTRGRPLLLPQDVRAYGMAPEDLEVALAVRMSMSIPFVFKPAKLRGAGGEPSYVVDGGFLSNFPVWLFDAPGIPSWPTFGFRLVRSGGFRVARYTIRSPISLLRAMYFTALEPHDADYIGAHDAARTIAIDALDVRATDFKLDRARKEALYESGVAAATAFLARWDFERYKAVYRGGGAVPARQAVPLS